MKKTVLFLSLFSLFFLVLVEAEDNSSDIKKKKKMFLFKSELEYGWKYNKTRFITQEAVEWTIIAGITAFDIALFRNYLTPSDNSFISGLDTSKEYKKEILPDKAELIIAGAGAGIAGSMILFLPNNMGFLNFEAYNNFKGYVESIVSTVLIVDILKFSFSQKRPDYDARVATGDKKIIEDGRLSFPSEHTALAFATSVYLTLYAFQYLGDNRIPAVIALKSIFGVCLNSLSVAMAVERVIENKHYIHDVVVGGLIGGAISAFFYCLHNYFGIYKKKSGNKKVNLSIEPDRKELGINMVLSF